MTATIKSILGQGNLQHLEKISRSMVVRIRQHTLEVRLALLGKIGNTLSTISSKLMIAMTGKVSIQLLAPQELIHILSKAINETRKSVKWMLPNRAKDNRDLYSLISAKIISLEDGTSAISVKIPLQDTEEMYKLFHINTFEVPIATGSKLIVQLDIPEGYICAHL